MSDRPARPEWRAAFLDRTLPRRPRRATADRGAPGTNGPIREALATSRRDAAPTGGAGAGSFPLSITAMLQIVPTA